MHLFLRTLLLLTFNTYFITAVTASDLNDFVEVPQLPVASKPVRAAGESKETFFQRVQTLHTKRAEEVFTVQRDFRLAVEDRNNRLLRGEERQSPSLRDPYDPLFLAYKNVQNLNDVNTDLEKLLNTKQKKYAAGKAWLFIIAIEEYEHTDPVLFAHRTGEIMREAFQKKLDISDRNTVKLYNKEATVKNIQTQLRKLVKRVQRNDIIYFYYCGHGLSSKSGEQLILPYDGMPDFADSKNTIKIERMYNKFLNSKALRTFSFIDTSFNGVTDGVSLRKGMADPKMRPRAEGYHKRLNILNSTRSQDTANAFFTREYRLFSYFLIKEVLSGPPNAGELFDNIRTKVRSVSREYGHEYLQEPEFFGYRELMMQQK